MKSLKKVKVTQKSKFIQKSKFTQKIYSKKLLKKVIFLKDKSIVLLCWKVHFCLGSVLGVEFP